MTQQARNIEVDNPYAYWRTAQAYEQEGDIKGAEIGYKAAVMAADKLPLAEYRRNYQEELEKHKQNPSYRTPPGVSLEELQSSYAELLTLPMKTRLLFASFQSRQNLYNEALDFCTGALSLRVEVWVSTHPTYLSLKQQCETLLASLQKTVRSTQTTYQSGILRQLRPRTVPKQATATTAQSYDLPDINELFNTHMRAQSHVSATDLIALEDQQALQLDGRAFVDVIFDCIKRFVDDLGPEQRKQLNIIFIEPLRSDEYVQIQDAFGIVTTRQVTYYRFRASTALLSMSVRATEQMLEVFIVPTRDTLNLSAVEQDHCRHACFEYRLVDGRMYWTDENFPLYPDDMRVRLRSVFKKLLNSSSEFMEGQNNSGTALTANTSLIKQLSDLSQERANLAEKIVYQQEMIQNRIARDIHDSIIADLLALKRLYEAHKATEEHVTSSLESVAQKLRNICSDLAPRDLQDWGLSTVVRDMANTVCERLGIPWTVNVEQEVPELPQQVILHIYRIIQECLNNIEKHAQANQVTITLKVESGSLVVTVEDDGVGFDPLAKDSRKAVQGGMGLDSIKERVELISCFHPAQLWIQSQPGKGTKTTLQINTQIQ